MTYLNTSSPRIANPQIISAMQLPEDIEVEIHSNRTTASGGNTTRIVDTTASANDSDVTIAVMGATGSGKTSFINLVSGSNLRVGKGLLSCTSIVQVANPFELDGRLVTLIDTPGFDDTTKSDAEVLRMIAAFLATAYENGKKLAGVIYLHRISDIRMGGISTRNFKMFRQLCGDSTLKNVVIVTNMWGEISKEVGEARETELMTQDMFFRPVLEKGAMILRHDNSQQSGEEILRHIIGNHPLSLRIQRELVDQKKDITQTAAGTELNRELMEQLEKHRNELRILQEEIREAMRNKDEETRKELEIETRKLQAEMNRVQEDSRKLATDYNQEKEKLEQRMTELSQKARQDASRTTEEYQRQINDLQNKLQQVANNTSAEKEDVMRQLSELRRRQSMSGRGIFGMLGSALDTIFGL